MLGERSNLKASALRRGACAPTLAADANKTLLSANSPPPFGRRVITANSRLRRRAARLQCRNASTPARVLCADAALRVCSTRLLCVCTLRVFFRAFAPRVCSATVLRVCAHALCVCFFFLQVYSVRVLCVCVLRVRSACALRVCSATVLHWTALVAVLRASRYVCSARGISMLCA